MHKPLVLASLAAFLTAWMTASRAAPTVDIPARRPIALALSEEGLLVAERDSGRIARIELATGKLASEAVIGQRLSDLVAHDDGFLACDEAAGELVRVVLDKGRPTVAWRRKVGVAPVRVVVQKQLASVACLWPRQIVVVNLNAPEAKLASIDLPFAPRCQVAAPHSTKVIVADSFGGNVAVVDLAGKRVEVVRQLAVHNIRGLALDRGGKNLLVTSQHLNSSGRPQKGDIEAGNLLANTVRKISLEGLVNPAAWSTRADQTYSLGDIEEGAGDPADVVDLGDGRVLVALSGVHEVAIGRPEEVLWTRHAVGTRPTAIALDPGKRRAYIANTFGDSISVVDVDGLKVVGEIKFGPTPTLTVSQRGEVHFHDARLSHDGWFSCQSCHTDGHTNGRLNDNFSDGSFGTPKRVLTLLGVKDTAPWAWNGKVKGLGDQVHNSLTSTMQGRTPSPELTADLLAYLNTLTPPPSVDGARGTSDAEAAARGRKLFDRLKCASCHAGTTYTSAGRYDVGLRDEAGESEFNPPSLRGVGQAGPYFHDNRALDLHEVFTRFRHRLAEELPAADVDDLVTFLKSL